MLPSCQLDYSQCFQLDQSVLLRYYFCHVQTSHGIIWSSVGLRVWPGGGGVAVGANHQLGAGKGQ